MFLIYSQPYLFVIMQEKSKHWLSIKNWISNIFVFMYKIVLVRVVYFHAVINFFVKHYLFFYILDRSVEVMLNLKKILSICF